MPGRTDTCPLAGRFGECDKFGMFEGFATHRIATPDVAINAVIGGSGPPVLLLHGYPQTHVMWHRVAPALARTFTVVAPDLRGYGDSDKPPGGTDHSAYCKRTSAADQVAAMAALGFDRFAVVGHDRGARVAHRLTLDHPDRVTRLAILDILPTYDTFASVDREFGLSTYHWFFLAQPADLPERMIGKDPEFFLRWTLNSWARHDGWLATEAFDEYLRCFRDPACIHATCEDYRAGAGIDLEHDAADRHVKIRCPVLVLWGARSKNGSRADPLAVWRDRATTVEGHPIPGGHFLAEEAPRETLDALQAFLGREKPTV